MEKRKIFMETQGTVVKVYSYPVINFYGRTEKYETGIIIKPDEEGAGLISECFRGRDYSEFGYGQRVVYVAYLIRRTATREDRERYKSYGLKCPLIIEEAEYVTYDEEEYEQLIGSKDKKRKR